MDKKIVLEKIHHRGEDRIAIKFPYERKWMSIAWKIRCN